jgi:hypothetical protein
VNAEQYENLLNNKRKKIVVGVVGSRRRRSMQDLAKLDSYVLSLMHRARKSDADLEFVSGGCKEGADAFIKGLCTRYKLPLTEHLPVFAVSGEHYWDKVNAYYARNKLIAEDCNFLIAMPAEDRKGGTENTIIQAQELGKKVILI